MICTTTRSAEETIAFGEKIGTQLTDGAILCFFGELGAGKTTLIKGLASGVTRCRPDTVNSPTFVYLNVYNGDRTLYHFDLYRLKDMQEFIDMGFDDLFHSDGICCIEWSEKIEPLLPEESIRVTCKHISPEEREITITGGPFA